MVSVLSKSVKNFIDVFEALEKIYFVEVGKYGGLEKILSEFDQNHVQIIERSEDEIRRIMKSHNNTRPFQGIKSIIK
jgi:tRNA G18 (ribose-2'-O)-methylase SpoU